MKKSLLAILTLLCTFTMVMGVGTACAPKDGDSSTSASEQVVGLTITGRPDGDTATITDTVNTLTLGCDEADAVWASSDEAVATVANGVVTLHSAGSTVISVSKGEKTGEFILTVVDERTPANITVTITGMPQDNEVLLSSGSLQLSATCSDGSEIVWLSHNEAVATVDTTGKVTLLQRGGVEIVAQKKGATNVYSVCTLKVLADPVTALTAILGIAENGNVGMGKPVQLSLVTEPANCEPFETEWSVADDTIVSVSANGMLSALKVGTTTVTATVKDTEITVSREINVVETKANYEDFSTAAVIGNYIVGEIEIRDGSNQLAPEIVYDEDTDNYYLQYSHAKADGNNDYMIYTFTGLETGARYVLKYNMKLLSKEGNYNHQINLYSDLTATSPLLDPLVGNVYNWHTTNNDTETAKVCQSGSTALYRDGARWKNTDDSMDDFHEYTLGFIAGESSVGFAFVSNSTYEVLFDYICVEKAPEVEEYTLTSTSRLPIGETYPITPVAVESLIYYQPFKLTWTSSDESVATVDENGVVTAVAEGEVTITAKDDKGVEKTVDITVVEAADKESYDIFYEETDPRVESNYLNIDYTLTEPVAVGAKQNDAYDITLEIDALYYVGNVQLYLGLVNSNDELIGQRNWTVDEFPVSGEKKTVTFTISVPWAVSNYDIETLRVYLRYGTSYQIGVNVISIEKAEPEVDPDAANYDLFIIGNGWSTDNAYTFEAPITGATYSGEYEITFEITVKQGTLDFIYFILNNANGDPLSNSVDINDATDGRLREVTAGSGTYAYTGTIKWNQPTGLDIAEITLNVYNANAYKVGINVSVEIPEVTPDPEEPEENPDDPEVESYDLTITGAYVPQTYTLETPITGAVQNDALAIVATIDTLEGNLNASSTDLYIELFGGVDATGTNVMNKWVELSDCLVEGTTNQYRFEIPLTWGLTDFTVSSIRMQLRANASCGIKIESVEVQKATVEEPEENPDEPTTESYDLELTAAWTPQTYILETPVTGAVQNNVVSIEVTIDILEGDLNASNTDLHIQLCNASGVEIRSLWVELSDCLVEGSTNKYKFTLDLKYAVEDLTVASITIQSRASAKCGINIESVTLVTE